MAQSRLSITLLCLLMAGCSSTVFELRHLKVSDAYFPAKHDEIGKKGIAQILGVAPLLPAPELQRYVNQVGRWIALQSTRPELAWRFGIIDTPVVCSYSAPGGYVLISVGLLEKLQTEAELASVLAFEIYRVSSNQHIRSMQAAANAENMFTMMGAATPANKTASQVAAQQLSARLVTTQFLWTISRQDMLAADVGGMILAARAGYNPYAWVGVLQMMGNLWPDNPPAGDALSATPSIAARLENIEKVIGETLEPFAEGAEQTPRFGEIKKILLQLKESRPLPENP